MSILDTDGIWKGHPRWKRFYYRIMLKWSAWRCRNFYIVGGYRSEGQFTDGGLVITKRERLNMETGKWEPTTSAD